MSDTKRRIANFRIDSVERTGQGALKVKANLTKTGVYNYQMPDGSVVREYRSPEEVFSQQALDTLHGSPVTLLHPSEYVTTGNWQYLAVGSVISTDKNDPYVTGTLLIHDQRVIQKIEDGELKEISCGYDADVVPAPEGVQHYDAAQKKLSFNHCAIGPSNWGRLGEDVSLRLDTNQELILPLEMIMNQETELEEKKIEPEVATGETVGEVDHDVLKDVVRFDSAEDEPTPVDVAFDAKAAFEALSAKVEALTAVREDSAKTEEAPAEEESVDIDALVEERANLLDSVRGSFRVIAPEADVAGKTVSDLCIEGLKTLDADSEGQDEKALVGMLHAAAQAASKVAASPKTKKEDSKPSFAERLLQNKISAPKEKSFAESLQESLS